MQSVGERFRTQGFSPKATEVIMASWRPDTKKVYSTYISKWERYAATVKVDPVSPPIAAAINFLAELHEKGASHSAVCIARSALSCYLNIPDFGNLDCVKRFIKGAFEQNPSFPMKSMTGSWDPHQVLTFVEPWVPHESLSLKELTLKLTMLLALLSGQRAQTIHCLDIKSMEISKNKCTFYVTKLLKHSRKSHHQEPLEFLAFKDNPSLCIVSILKEYLERTQSLRTHLNESRLFISYQAPHKPVSRDTVKRWIKTLMKMAGVDVTTFTAHSTRAASTSGALKSGVPIQTILSAAGWSQESTFAKFYKKNIRQNFGHSFLDSYFAQTGNI